MKHSEHNGSLKPSAFAKFARWTEYQVGRPTAFALAFLIVVLWAVTGPFFGWSDTWQLIINTGTTIVTFLMVFIIQNTQSRDTRALQLKLDELIRANEAARNSLIGVEEKSESAIEGIKSAFGELPRSAGSPRLASACRLLATSDLPAKIELACIPTYGSSEMLTVAEAQQRTELFLTGQMIEALRAVEYELPSFDAEPREVHLSDAARSQVQIRHVRGASDATYLIDSFGDELLMQLQLNIHRLVVVYRVPALEGLDANTLAVRLERWRLGAEHAGWKFGWRDVPVAGDPGRRYVETYCYAFAGRDFLEDEAQQLYWRTDIVQMTRYFMIEAAHSGIRLSPRHAGFPL